MGLHWQEVDIVLSVRVSFGLEFVQSRLLLACIGEVQPVHWEVREDMDLVAANWLITVQGYSTQTHSTDTFCYQEGQANTLAVCEHRILDHCSRLFNNLRAMQKAASNVEKAVPYQCKFGCVQEARSGLLYPWRAGQVVPRGWHQGATFLLQAVHS